MFCYFIFCNIILYYWAPIRDQIFIGDPKISNEDLGVSNENPGSLMTFMGSPIKSLGSSKKILETPMKM